MRRRFYGFNNRFNNRFRTTKNTDLFGYLNPYYRSAYNVSKRRK